MVIGALLGVLALHPVTMVIYWFEFQHYLAPDSMGLAHFLADRMWRSFSPAMLHMTGLFATIGIGIGLLFARVQATMAETTRTVQQLRDEMIRDLPLVIASGESERVEFKASVRWDYSAQRVNRALETAVMKTIAGFLNAEGGSLILGVGDRGEIRGLQRDFGTLNRADRDGYEQFLIGLVKKRLGGDLCPLIHLVFTRHAAQEVCRVVIEPAHRPVYLDEGGSARLYLRMGNSTRGLDIREAVDYVEHRWLHSAANY